MTGPVAKLRRAEVTALRSAVEEGLPVQYVTVQVPAEAGTTRSLEIPCPAHFAPEVGDTVTLAMSGAVPSLFPDVIAADSITAREIIAGTITALLVDGDTIIAGDYPDGYYVLISDAGVQLLDGADGDAVIVSLDTATGDALITGLYKSAKDGERFEIEDAEVRFYPSEVVAAGHGAIEAVTDGFTGKAKLVISGTNQGTQFGRVTLEPTLTRVAYTNLTGSVSSELLLAADSAGLTIVGAVAAVVSVTVPGILVSHPALVVIDSPAAKIAASGVTKVETNSTGVGFNATAPIAKPALNGAASTAGEALALVNQIRAALINYGLCT